MFKKILVPLDGLEIAAKVLPKVVELAKASCARLLYDTKRARGALACHYPIFSMTSLS